MSNLFIILNDKSLANSMCSISTGSEHPVEEHHGTVCRDPVTKFWGAHLIKHSFRNFPKIILHRVSVRARDGFPYQENRRRGYEEGAFDTHNEMM